MNERIRELAEQAEGTKKHVPAVWQFYDHELEKFAELIVERIIDNVECHASLFNTKEAQQVCSWIVKSVKYDFGLAK